MSGRTWSGARERAVVTRLALSAALLAALLAAPRSARALEGKLGGYLQRIEPHGQDSRDFSRASWGGGLYATFPAPFLGSLLAGSAGFEYANMLSDDKEFQDPQTLLRVVQETRQYYARVFLGPEFGPHGNGFLRPHVGANLACAFYGIHTDVVVPDDYNRQQEIRQSLRYENNAAFGYDVNVGLDLNMGKFSTDGGVRFIKSFNVPQQLGPGSVSINPGYFQIWVGVAVNLSELGRP